MSSSKERAKPALGALTPAAKRCVCTASYGEIPRTGIVEPGLLWRRAVPAGHNRCIHAGLLPCCVFSKDTERPPQRVDSQIRPQE